MSSGINDSEESAVSIAYKKRKQIFISVYTTLLHILLHNHDYMLWPLMLSQLQVDCM